MKRIGYSIFAVLSVGLTACGGSGSGDNFNSSFEKTFTYGNQTYICRSEKAANACGGATQDCSACETSSSEPLITAACTTAVEGTNTVYNATTAGCVAKMKSNSLITAVCTATDLRLLTKSGFSKNYLLQNGEAYPNKTYSVSLTSEIIRCS